MKSHPYVRAYMAGVLVPTWGLLVALAAFVVCRLVYEIPIPIERAIAFPMAIVPNLWGVWNVLFHAGVKRKVTLGVWGALLPVLLVPSGILLARALEIQFVTWGGLGLLPVASGAYYLVWRHIVGFFDDVVGLPAR